MRTIFIVAISLIILASFASQNAFSEKASGKPAWQYGSATESIICGDKLCSEVEKKSKPQIPEWIKNNALWWSEDSIDDASFLSGIQFLIDEKIIKISAATKNSSSLPFVPNWIKDTAGWWATGKVTDSDFVNGMVWLIENGMIQVSATELVIDVSGSQQVRRGTTHTISVDVSRNNSPVQDAWVVITIEDYGEDIIREFDGYTDEDGYFEFSWEIPKTFDDVETLLAYVGVSDDLSAKTVLFEFQVYCLPGEVGCKAEGN